MDRRAEEATEMNPLGVLMLVMSPLLVALSASDVEVRLLAWYLAEALLVAGLLGVLLAHERRWPMRLAYLSGIALHVAAVGCGVVTDSGACDSDAGLPGAALFALVALGVVAEVVARLERKRRWRETNAQG